MNPAPTLREILARSKRCLTDDAIDAVATFIMSKRGPDGGFAGKASGSDLYYTMFAAAVLDALGYRSALLKLPRYLRAFGDGGGLDFVHLACLAQLLSGLPLRSKHLDPVLERIESFRSRDGGYNHLAPDSGFGCAYAAHLAIETRASAKRPITNPDAIVKSLATLRAYGGGYANERSKPVGLTNATAAACIALLRLGVEPDSSCLAFFEEMRDSASGGFRAFPGAREPDLLSTASALCALKCMGASIDAITSPARAFVEALWTDDGGFVGAPSDNVPDCEYTCHALLVLGALL